MEQDHLVLLESIQFACRVDRHRALTEHLMMLSQVHSDNADDQSNALDVGGKMVVYISILLFFMAQDGWAPPGRLVPSVIPTQKAFDEFSKIESRQWSFHSYREMADIAANTLFLKDPITDNIRPPHIRSVIRDSLARAFEAFEVNGGYLETKLTPKE